jgi:hypothetical protein
MNRKTRVLVWLVAMAALLVTAAGCKKANPDDAETQALARQFITTIYVNHDATTAMSLVVAIANFGYITEKIVQDTIDADVKNRCSVAAESVLPGPTGDDVTIAEIRDSDTDRGITERTAWVVASKAKCAGSGSTVDRTAIVFLEKVNGKWGVSKVSWEIGGGGNHAPGLN